MNNNQAIINKYYTWLGKLQSAFDDPFCWNTKCARVLEEFEESIREDCKPKSIEEERKLFKAYAENLINNKGDIMDLCDYNTIDQLTFYKVINALNYYKQLNDGDIEFNSAYPISQEEYMKVFNYIKALCYDFIYKPDSDFTDYRFYFTYKQNMVYACRLLIGQGSVCQMWVANEEETKDKYVVVIDSSIKV